MYLHLALSSCLACTTVIPKVVRAATLRYRTTSLASSTSSSRSFLANASKFSEFKMAGNVPSPTPASTGAALLGAASTGAASTGAASTSGASTLIFSQRPPCFAPCVCKHMGLSHLLIRFNLRRSRHRRYRRYRCCRIVAVVAASPILCHVASLPL